MWVIAFTVIVGAMAVIFDGTIVSVALHDLTTELHASLGAIQWVTTGYLLAMFVTIPIAGWAQAVAGGKSAAPPQNGCARTGDSALSPRAMDRRPAGRTSKLEFQLLLILALADRQVVAAAELAHRLWGDSSADALARLDVHLSLLRTQLGETAKESRYVQRVRGVGIRLTAPES